MLKPSNLKELKIEVTQKCPLNCLHCSSEANISKNQELTKDIVLRIISEAKQMGVKEITFSGGEPLIWEHLSETLAFCKQNGIKSVIYTTGIPLKINTELISIINEYSVSKVIVSLFGPSPESHDYITRVNGSFALTIEAIRVFRKFMIPIGIHFVAMRPNWQQLEGIMKLADSFQVETVSVLRFVPHGRGKIVDHFSLDKKELLALRRNIINLRKTSKSYIRLGSPFNILLVSKDINCTAACDRLIIGSDGKIFPCDAFKNIEYEGNLDSIIENSLQDVWKDSDYLKEIRMIILQGLGPECSRCSSCILCKGGCLAQKVIRIKDYMKPDPDCLKDVTGGSESD